MGGWYENYDATGQGGVLIMRAEHLKAWMTEVNREENPAKMSWYKVVETIQLEFGEGGIMMECA